MFARTFGAIMLRDQECMKYMPESFNMLTSGNQKYIVLKREKEKE